MNKTSKIQPQRIWFGRWNNKSWAVFRSLNRVVHILPIKVEIVNQSFLKQGMMQLNALVSSSDFAFKLIHQHHVPDDELLLQLLLVEYTQDNGEDCQWQSPFPRFNMPVSSIDAIELAGFF